ncbi:MAG: hypothetical protein JW834_01410, partial [Candidatus Diapherotrites archaeon]|nr:hypothetical protein [Candidatus Diapherotrites archaeon]
SMDFVFDGGGVMHSYQTENLEDGEYYVYVRCRDVWGNTATASYSWDFTVDTTLPDEDPPIVTIHSPQNATYNDSDIPLNYSVSETPAWCGYSLDGAANITLSGNTTFEPGSGTHVVVVACNDSGGNVGAGSVVFTVDVFQTIMITPDTAREDDGNWWSSSYTSGISDGLYVNADDYWHVMPDWVELRFPWMGLPGGAVIQDARVTILHKEYIMGSQIMTEDVRHMFRCRDPSQSWHDVETYDVTDVWANYSSPNLLDYCMDDDNDAQIRVRMNFDPSSATGSFIYIDWARLEVQYTV